MIDPRDRVLHVALRRLLGEEPEGTDLAAAVRARWESEQLRRPEHGVEPRRTARGTGRPPSPASRPPGRHPRTWWPTAVAGIVGLGALGLWLARADRPPATDLRGEAPLLALARPPDAPPVWVERPAGPLGSTDVLLAPPGGVTLHLAGRALYLDAGTLLALEPGVEDTRVATLRPLRGRLRLGAGTIEIALDLSAGTPLRVPPGTDLALTRSWDPLRLDSPLVGEDESSLLPDPIGALALALADPGRVPPTDLWRVDLRSGANPRLGEATLAAGEAATSYLAVDGRGARVLDPALHRRLGGFLADLRKGEGWVEPGRFPPFGEPGEALAADLEREPAQWQLVLEELGDLHEGYALAATARRHLQWWLVRADGPRTDAVLRALWRTRPEAFDAQTLVALAERGLPEFRAEVEAYFPSTDEDDPLPALPFAAYLVLRGDERRVPTLDAALARADSRPMDAGLAALVLLRRGQPEPFADWRRRTLGLARRQLDQGALEFAAYLARAVPWMDGLADAAELPPVAFLMERAGEAALEGEPLLTPDEVREALEQLER